MSLFQSIEVLAKRLTSLKDSSVESSQPEVQISKPIGAFATAVQSCSVDDEFLLGLEYKNNSQFLQAIEKFKSVENQSPGYREIYTLLQETYALAAEKEIDDKNYISALSLLKKSQALSMSSQTIATLLAHKAYCEHHLGQVQQSLETVKKAITVCHDTVINRYKTQIHGLGWERLFQSPIDLPSSRGHLPPVNVLSSQVDHLNSQNLEPVPDKESQNSLESKHTPDELSLFEKAAELCPDLADSLKHNPDSSKAHYSLGCYYYKRGEGQEALKHLTQVDMLQSGYEGASELIRSIQISLNLCTKPVTEIIVKQDELTSALRNTLPPVLAVSNLPHDYEAFIEEPRADHHSELLLEDKEIDSLLLKVHQLSQKVSDSENTSNVYFTRLQDSEKLIQSLRTNHLTELSAKDNELVQMQQKLSQLSSEVDLLKSSLRTERDKFTAGIDNLKEQLHAVQSQKIDAIENVSSNQKLDVLSTQELSILSSSEFWGEFKTSPSPSKLISNFVWEKSRSDLSSTKYSCLVINDLAKQLNLELISDSSETVGKYIALTLYDFLNRTVDYDIDTVILCVTALITLVDAQKVDDFRKPTTAELPTVANPSGDGRNFAIPRPPTEESKPIQEPQQIADIHFDIQIPADTLDLDLIRKKLLETEKVSILLSGIFVEEDDSALGTARISISEKNLLKLDETHSAFLCVMLTKRIWRRDELEKLASGAKLLLDGVLHTINEEVYDAYGEPLFEGENAIELNLEIVQQILSETDQYGSIS